MRASVICWIALGVIAGMFSRRIIGGQGYGMLADIVLGSLGAAVGGWTARSFPTSVLTAVIGAVAIIWLSTRPAKEVRQRNSSVDQKLRQ